ncbi:MAG: DUF5317 family protein, partial [Acidimicrobiales bacterium]
MVFTVLALALGLALGLATGGRLSNLSRRRQVRGWWLLAAGVLAQVLARILGGGPALAATLVSYAAFVGFAGANLVLSGMGLVVVGLGLNALVIAVDGGMPVTASAAAATGLVAAPPAARDGAPPGSGGGGAAGGT